jgi:PAS domain S-box-containing protein
MPNQPANQPGKVAQSAPLAAAKRRNQPKRRSPPGTRFNQPTAGPDGRNEAKLRELLAEASQNLRAAFAATDILMLLDIEGRILEISPGAALRFGKTEEAMRGALILDHFPPELARSREKVLQQVLATRQSARHEDRSEGRFFESTVYPILDAKGIVQRLLVYSHETTRVKNIERLSQSFCELALKLAETSSLNSAIRLSLETMLQVSGLDCGGIYLVDPVAGHLCLASSVGLSPEFIARVRFEPRDSPRSQLVMSGKAHFISVTPAGLFDGDIGFGRRVKAMAILPVSCQGKITACFVLASTLLDEVPEEVRTTMVAIGGQMGNVLARVQAEEARSRSDERFKQLVDTAQEGIWAIDAEGLTSFANPKLASLLGYSVEAMMGTSIYTYMDQATAIWCRGLIEKSQATPVREQEAGFVGKDGQPLSALVAYSPLATKLDSEGGGLLVVVDLSQRKQLEQKLRQSESEYRQLVELTPDGIGIISQERIQFLNRSGLHLLGAECPQDILGCQFLQFVHRDDRERVKRLLDQAQRQKSVMAFSGSRLVQMDGTFLEVEIAAIPFNYQGENCSQIVLRDVTRFRQAEQKLKENADKLQVLSRRLIEVQESERRDLAGQLHDEIGQVLTCVNLTLETWNQSSLAQIRRQLPSVQGQVKELIGFVRSLALDLRPCMLDNLGLLPALLSLFERFASLAHVHIDFQHDGIEQRLSSAIETSLYRIIQEACTNAARHSEANEVAIRIKRSTDHVQVQIQDSGKGFNPAKALSKGTSSGLHGMLERAKLAGGSLVINSALGAGTCIFIEIPLNPTMP